MRVFNVYRVDYSGNRLARVGQASVDDDDRMSLIELAPDVDEASEARLGRAVAALNGAADLVKKEPPAAEQNRFAVRKTLHQRGSPVFFSALQDNLRRWHGFELGEAPE